MNRIKISFDQSIYQSKFISSQILHIGGFVKLNKINNYMKKKEYYIFFFKEKKKRKFNSNSFNDFKSYQHDLYKVD